MGRSVGSPGALPSPLVASSPAPPPLAPAPPADDAWTALEAALEREAAAPAQGGVAVAATDSIITPESRGGAMSLGGAGESNPDASPHTPPEASAFQAAGAGGAGDDVAAYGCAQARLYVSTCSHRVHLRCMQGYVAAMVTTEEVATERGEFACPQCRRLSNAMLPITPHASIAALVPIDPVPPPGALPNANPDPNPNPRVRANPNPNLNPNPNPNPDPNPDPDPNLSPNPDKAAKGVDGAVVWRALDFGSVLLTDLGWGGAMSVPPCRHGAGSRA